VALVAVACGTAPEGYEDLGDGVHWRLIELGDGERTAQDEDSVHVALRITAAASPRTVLYAGAAWCAAIDLRGSAFDGALGRMHAGDRAHVIAPYGRIPWKALRAAPPASDDTARVLVDLVLEAVGAPAGHRQEHAPGPAADGRRAVQLYLGRGGAPWHRWGNSMFHYRIEGPARDTARVRHGDRVTIHYTGRRLVDSVLVDDPLLEGEGFSFRFGDRDQVVEGMEVAVSLLREGETGHFILPGEMAFGARGVPGAVAPYEPLLYTVRLVRVERADTSAR
jgi:hypothetical protein